jgi:2-oxoglutarate ferredoxin oxidoreductase subunit alpha
MRNDVFTFLVGGKAGDGVKKAGSVASRFFASVGRRVFQMDDYQSLIRGGHSFTVVSTGLDETKSHYADADIVVALDARSYERHRGRLAPGGLLVYNSDVTKDADGIGVPFTSELKKYAGGEIRIGVGAVAVLAAALGLDRERTERLIRDEYPRDLDDNAAYAGAIYDLVYPGIGGKYHPGDGARERPLLYGNEAIALGMAAGGLDLYFAYPMTPSSSILHYLAARGEELGVVAVHPENEIAAANMAIGAGFAGARVAVGSSGGGFALMGEAFSLAGMSEAPILFVVSSRPGPSTGVPTYTEQGDLGFVSNVGHGEFPRVVASPGSVEEAFYLAAEMLALVWRFQTPGILLTEKHLSESKMTVDIDVEQAAEAEPLAHVSGEYKRYLVAADGISPMLFPPSNEMVKWDSYEHDENGITTEDPVLITEMHDKRRRKGESLEKHLAATRTVNVFGEGDPVIFTYGSTTMSVREAVRAGGIDATVVQPVYLRPLPVKALREFDGRLCAVVEQSGDGQFATLLEEKAGIKPGAVIRRYDGRPFEPTELAREIKGVI